ncbi:MAG: hypothetical protein AB7D39_07055 [Pseudodesulfovibrio sp.]|uniref:hypothetical protein n=1 Tax=Pseudodesulfovibrio sp. TaxID=2035812 RepID=UPI003D0D1117
MGKMRGALLLAALFLLLAGCGGKAVPIGELTCGNVRTLVENSTSGKTARFEYCLDEVAPGSFIVQGNGQFQAMGDIRNARLKLVLLKDKKVVERIPLRVRATQMDKKVYFYKEFKYSEPFDSLYYDFSLKYRF